MKCPDEYPCPEAAAPCEPWAGKPTTDDRTVHDDQYYEIKSESRGICVIINQEEFDSLQPRPGTNKDAESLENTFEALSFTVAPVKTNLTKAQIEEELKYWSEFDHTVYDAFVFCILSHGGEDTIYATDEEINIDDILGPFSGENCESLRGKPKLFFFQACRGGDYDRGALVRDQADPGRRGFHDDPADFLIAQATWHGFVSFRNEIEGSWFIQSLCEVLGDKDRVYDNDILSLLTIVNTEVGSLESQSQNWQWNKCKQSPSISSTLTKKFRFGTEQAIDAARAAKAQRSEPPRRVFDQICELAKSFLSRPPTWFIFYLCFWSFVNFWFGYIPASLFGW